MLVPLPLVLAALLGAPALASLPRAHPGQPAPHLLFGSSATSSSSSEFAINGLSQPLDSSSSNDIAGEAQCSDESPSSSSASTTTTKAKAKKSVRVPPKHLNSRASPSLAKKGTVTVVKNPKAVLNPKWKAGGSSSSAVAAAGTGKSNAKVYGPGLGTFSYLPRPSTFVKRSGSGLTLDGNEYRIVGPNIYWLGLDENVVPNPSYPDQGRVREAFAIAAAMGANTVRSHTLGVSTGNSLSVWPSWGNTNAAAFVPIDYAIWAARNYGIRLIIPLTDNYAYYHGGKYDFIGWAGLDTSDGSQFYTSAATKIFKQYISVLLNHVNTFTGVALKDDPTILAWETGNELGGYMLQEGAPPQSWTQSIASYIKSIAPNHLVSDGSDGLVDLSGSLMNTGFGASSVDMVTDHFYPAMDWLLNKDDGYLKSSTSKNFFVGELDWTNQHGGDSLSSFYSILENMTGSGSMMWSVFGHDAQCCNYVEHNDGYSLMYPNGNTAALQKQALLVVQHWYRMRGLTAPSALPAVACPQPALEL
ncbi:mannan endo-1,4-beta-mannosidase, glycoside hydrolase family 5 protein [Pseudohyphozyma bogoriensis]|nr:mannan endo-1,4-beta-mannosidase, glycoside hydrolase family 5 protein [Pseudohyphozyma bogoriensis]